MYTYISILAYLHGEFGSDWLDRHAAPSPSSSAQIYIHRNKETKP